MTPSIVAARSARPASPPPGLISAPPWPLSVISTTTVSSERHTFTPAAVAPECLAMFVNALHQDDQQFVALNKDLAQLTDNFTRSDQSAQTNRR